LKIASQHFEKLVFDTLNYSNKYVNVSQNTKSGKRQIDILALKQDGLLDMFEIKSFRSKIRLGLVEQVYGKWLDISKGTESFAPHIVSSTSYTKLAIQRAEELKITLWNTDDLRKLLDDDAKWKEIHNEYVNEIIKFTTDSTQGKPINEKSKEVIFIENIKDIDPGKTTWSTYQQTIYDILEHLFCPPLDSPLYELADKDKRNRRDIIFENTGEHFFWKHIKEEYRGLYIVIDAKNYTNKLTKRPIIDIAHYLKPYGCGMFGIIVTRKGLGPAGQHARKEQWIGNRKMILVLSDSEILEMLRLKLDGEKPEEVLRRKISNFRMNL